MYVCTHARACAHTHPHIHSHLSISCKTRKSSAKVTSFSHITERKLMPDKEVQSVPQPSSPRAGVCHPVMVTSASFSLQVFSGNLLIYIPATP